MTRQTVSNWELGQGSPALDKAAELARLYDVTLNDLASDEVDVVCIGKGGRARDLHVLEGLVGKVVTVELATARALCSCAHSEHWRWVDSPGMRCSEGGFPDAIFREKEPPQRVLKLVDMADVAGFTIEEDAN